MIDYTKIKVLLVDGADRQTLPLARAFKELGCTVGTWNYSKLDNGYTSRYPDIKIIDAKAKDDLIYFIDALERHLQNGRFNLVVTTSDLTAEALSINKKRLEQFAKIAVVEPELFYIAYDKLNTMKICMDNNIPCPKTLLNIETVNDVLSADLTYPVVVKPRKSFGAIGFKRVETEEKLIKLLTQVNCDLKSLIIQEYIPQTEIQYDAIMFIDNENNIKSALVCSKNRWFPINGGASTMSVTVDRPDIVGNCSKLLKLIGWYGCADIDLIQDPRDNVVKIMEINPRISANVKICFAAGINLAKQIIEATYWEEVQDYLEYKKDIRLRCIHTDLLWFIKSENRLKTKPSWFSIKNTKDQIFSIKDPLPFFAFSLKAIGNYRKEIKKRSSVT